MIKADNLTKRFENFMALDSLSCTIRDGCIYGMVGSNGAGKSTFLRLISGVYRPDSGSVTFDGENVYENPEVKARLAFVPDELFFLPSANMERMAQLYRAAYPRFDTERYRKLASDFGLDVRKSLVSFSKGMRRQASTILALSAKPDYIFFDETFDGLDPVMRNYVKNLITADVCDRGASAIITSHSLRELEDTCDQLALLHKGGLVLENDIQDLKTERYKVQVAFAKDFSKEDFQGIEIVSFAKQGSVANIIVRGDREETVEKIRAMDPLLIDVLPLTLEEIFTYEMEALGYKFNLAE